MRRQAAIFPALLFLALLSGCSGDTKRPPQEPAVDFDEQVQEGWAAFNAGNLPASRAIFLDLVESFPDAAEGYTGLGWCEISQGNPATGLETLLAADRLAGGADAAAGLAVAASAVGRDSIAVEAAARITDSSYVFAGDPDFTYRDVVYIRALGEFHLLRYEDCYTSLSILAPDLWIDFREYDFREQLFAALESLRGRV